MHQAVVYWTDARKTIARTQPA